jgi:cobalt-zinc-cadmium efflux system membrane fusion protein
LRPVVIWGTVFVGLAAAAVGCSHTEAAPTSSLPPGEVWLTSAEVARDHVVEDTVQLRGLDDILVSSGRLSFDEGRVAHVISPVTGRVVKIDGALGQQVAKGQTLAVLSSPDLGDATSALNKAMADRVASEHAYHRAQQLHDEGGASDAVLEQAQDAWRIAKAEEERAREKVALLHAGRTVTETYPLTSPIAGTVVARTATPGVEVQGAYTGGSQELFTVGDIDQLWLFADVYEADLGRVHAAQAVDLTVVGVPTVFHTTIDYVADMLDPQTRTARLRCTVLNQGHTLEPEMYGTVRVHVAPIQTLAIPREAILHLGGQQLVFIQRGPSSDGRTRFERIPVVADETGTDAYVPVHHGVDGGERIVSQGAAALSAML